MTNAAAPDGVPPPLPMDPVERVFPVARVCSVTTPDGAGHGILCTLKGAPCVLTPAHVLGEAEDEPGCFDQHDARVAAARRARVRAHRADPLDGDGDGDGDCAATVTRLRLPPEVFFAFSAARRPGARRTPTGWTTRSSRATPNFPTRRKARLRTRRATRYPRRGARTPKSAFARFCSRARWRRRGRARRASPATNCTWARATAEPSASRASPGAAARHRAAAGARRDDEARAATATATVPLAREPPPDTRERSLRTTRVRCARRAHNGRRERRGGDGAPRRAPRLDADFAARRKPRTWRRAGAARWWPCTARAATARMARVMVCEILKDVKETLAAGKVRDAAGEAAVAVAELARGPARRRAPAPGRRRRGGGGGLAPGAGRRWPPGSTGGTSRSGRRSRGGGGAPAGARLGRVRPPVRAAGGERRARARAPARARMRPGARRRPGTRASSRRWTGTTRTRRSARRRGGRTACGAPGRLDEVYVLPLRVFVENPFYR